MAKILTGEWQGFNDGEWQDSINVSEFIIRNFTEYKGDDSFLASASEKTKAIFHLDFMKQQLIITDLIQL